MEGIVKPIIRRYNENVNVLYMWIELTLYQFDSAVSVAMNFDILSFMSRNIGYDIG